MTLLDGKATSERLKESIAAKVMDFATKYGRVPHLSAIIVGEDGASLTYVASKENACAKVGIRSSVFRFPESISQNELLEEVIKINEDPEIDGLIIQLPLPRHIEEQAIIGAIAPEKDVDGVNPVNAGRLAMGLEAFAPATPSGIMMLLKEYGIETKGKHCVVLGRSNIVGRPIATLLSQKNIPGDCTVTLCHSRTRDIATFTRQADIIIAAIGIPEFLKGEMVKEGAVVIDVGITRIEDGSAKGYHLAGDVAFDEVAPKSSFITPVPGGTGPMTIVSLLENTLKAAQMQMEK